MHFLQPFQEIESFDSIAKDFTSLLPRDDNADIKREFPGTVRKYGENMSLAIENLEETSRHMKLGEREQFIVMMGDKAVGLCLITAQIENPPGVDPSWPNISGFIMNPYRGQGLGRFSIEERMKIVKQNFGDHAWTFVTNGNVRSEHLVQDVGFQKTDLQIAGNEGRTLYIYEGSNT